MKRIPFLLMVLVLGTVFCRGQYPNIIIGNVNSPNEPSIVINPKNTNYVVAGANLDNFYFSTDGGYSWQNGLLDCTYGVWGDPCIAVDTAGSFYYFHLSAPSPPGNWIDRIVCQKSTDNGQTWSNGSYAGLNGSKAQDKEWAAIDRTNNTIYIAWTQFDNYGSILPGDSSIIRFSKSADGGQTWSLPVRINKKAGDCLDSDNTVEGAVPAVGPEGEVYVAWAGPLGLVFNRSADGGNTWPDSNIFVSTIPGGWDFNVAGIQRCNGLPVTCCDLSNGPNRGTIYINWADQRNGANDADIWLVRSTDNGSTWSAPKRVNDDPPGHQQFFTWMTIDPVTGYLWFVFYDRREHDDNSTDVYMAVSRDGGETFLNFRVSESPFNPDPIIFFGDYTNISAYNGIVRPIWTRLNNDSLSLMTAVIDSMFVGITKRNSEFQPGTLGQNYPNPVEDVTAIPFRLHSRSDITIRVYDIFGNEVATIVSDRIYEPGKYIEYFNASEHNLVPGFYYLSLRQGDYFAKRKMIVK
jgi:hypothetical protein